MGATLTNPGLRDTGFLVGVWDVELSNASFLDHGQTVAGRLEAAPIEGGMLLALRQRDADEHRAGVGLVGDREGRLVSPVHRALHR